MFLQFTTTTERQETNELQHKVLPDSDHLLPSVCLAERSPYQSGGSAEEGDGHHQGEATAMPLPHSSVTVLAVTHCSSHAPDAGGRNATQAEAISQQTANGLLSLLTVSTSSSTKFQ